MRKVHKKHYINWLKVLLITITFCWAAVVVVNDLLDWENTWFIVMPFFIASYLWTTSKPDLYLCEKSFSYNNSNDAE